jgi:hypothetical protein
MVLHWGFCVTAEEKLWCACMSMIRAASTHDSCTGVLRYDTIRVTMLG